MVDPISLPAQGALVASTAGAIAAAGTTLTILGFPIDLAFWGAVGGLASLFSVEPSLPIVTPMQVAKHAGSRIFIASLFGGLGSGIALPVLASQFAVVKVVEPNPLAPILAAVIIGLASSLLPEGMAFLKSFLNRGESK